MSSLDVESPAESISDPARNGDLRTREAVFPIPRKPRAVLLDMGHLGLVCSHNSRGSRKLQEPIIVALGALLAKLLFTEPASMFTEAQGS